jgi:hypothetical protein
MRLVIRPAAARSWALTFLAARSLRRLLEVLVCLVESLWSSCRTRRSNSRARKLLLEISTSWWKGLGQFRPAALQGVLWGRACAYWREIWSKCPPFRVQNFDQPVEDPSTISETSGLRPVNFDPSTSLRALSNSRQKQQQQQQQQQRDRRADRVQHDTSSTASLQQQAAACKLGTIAKQVIGTLRFNQYPSPLPCSSYMRK